MSVSIEKARIDHQVLTPIFSRTEPDRNTLAEYQIHLAAFFGISVPECLGRCVGTHPEKLWVKIPNYFCLSAYHSRGTHPRTHCGSASLSWLRASRRVSSMCSRRLSVRIAASTYVESVRWVPRALIQPRALHAVRKVSRNRWGASWASKRSRKSCNNVKSKPGSCKSRLRAYFQSMQRRTASAAWRSVSPSIYCITTTSAKRQGATSTGRPSGG